MRLRLVAPTKRKDSANLQFEQRIPADLKERLVGMTLEVPRGGDIVPITITDKMRSIRYSLKAADAGEAKRRQAEAIAYLEGVYLSLRVNAPIILSPRQQMGLAAKRAKAFLAAHADDPFSAPLPLPLPMPPEGGEAAWGAMVGRLDAATRQALARDLRAFIGERDDGRRSRLAFSLLSDYPGLKALVVPDMAAGLEAIYGADTDAALFAEGLQIDAATRRMVNFEMARFKGIAERGLEAMQSGDYRSLTELEAAPLFDSVPKTAPAVSLRGLFKSWWAEAKNAGRSVSTKESYETAVEALAAFLGHDDAGKVSPDDVVRFKEHLVSTINPRTKKPLSAKTIKDSYLAGLKSVLAWAVDNRKLSSNPAEGITVKAARKVRVRDPWFSQEEIRGLLGQALKVERGHKEPLQRFEARRWVPWLCAYTGARVGEMVQLRKHDVRQIEGHWVLAITPEAITVKGNQGREVPIHPHLIEMGFLDFVRASPDGFLFLWSGEDRAAWRTAKNRMVEAARKVVPDPNIAPNHGWRHTFKTIGVEAGIAERVLDAICGHAPKTIGEKYGGVTVAAKAQAMEKFPRFVVKGEG